MARHRMSLHTARILAALEGAKEGAREAGWREAGDALRDAAVLGLAYTIAFWGAVGDVARQGMRRLRRPLGRPSRFARS